MGGVVRLQGRALSPVTLFVDTSVWSLAFRPDQVSTAPQVRVLRDALEGGETIVVTGLVLQELLQGFTGPKARKDIIDRFAALAPLGPGRVGGINCAVGRRGCS